MYVIEDVDYREITDELKSIDIDIEKIHVIMKSLKYIPNVNYVNYVENYK